MLVVTRKCGEIIRIGESCEVTLLKVGKDKARIGVVAPGQPILRDNAVRRNDRDQKAVVMRSDRTLCEVDSAFMFANADLLHYTRASDGVWVPSCDLVQYESGKRGVA